MFSGPIPVSQFMSLCLTHPQHGYYTSRDNVFGSKGDFITAPEVSQVFGEMVAVWVASVVKQMPTAQRGFSLAELGPGKGTMMKDIIRSLRAFDCLPKQVHLVEASTTLRNVQKTNLAAVAEENQVELVWHGSLAHVPDVDGNSGAGSSALPAIYVAQEFFDALPVHVFKRTENGHWREQLIDVIREDVPESSETPFRFRYVLAPGDTPASAMYRSRFLDGNSFLPGGSLVELCAEGIAVAEELSKRVVRSGGAALVIDYGSDDASVDSIVKGEQTIRSIRGHKTTSVLSRPGQSDVTADVNFGHLRSAVESSGAKFHGSVTQEDFLLELGAAARFRSLGVVVADDATLTISEKDAKLAQLQVDYDRLVSPLQMGRIYRACGISSAAISPVALQLKGR